jgi:hypothetical protein
MRVTFTPLLARECFNVAPKKESMMKGPSMDRYLTSGIESLISILFLGGVILAQTSTPDQSTLPNQQSSFIVAQSQPPISNSQDLHITLHEDPKPFYKEWTFIGLLAGWGVALSQYFLNRADKRAEQTRQYLLDSLRWFSGETQPRSIGIAVIEANWDLQDEMRPYWTRVLAVQAIHLLARSKEKDSRVEEANLDRIMTLLTRDNAELLPRDRERLGRVLEERHAGTRLESGGIDLGNLQKPLADWVKRFPPPAQL